MLASTFKHNATLSRRQCAHIMTTEGMKAAFQDIDTEGVSATWTAPEEMFNLFKKKRIFFGMLYHSKDIIKSELPGWEAKRRQKRLNVQKSNCENEPPLSQMQATGNITTSTITTSINDEIRTETTRMANGVCIFETFLPGDDNGNDALVPKVLEDSALLEAANNCQEAFDASNNQDIVLSIVWAMPEMRQLFRAFPEVLFIDGTHKTNNEKYPLFTVGIRDANFKVRIVLRAFCPNKRAWMFEWFFNEAIPSILKISACKRIKTIITDGYSQETKGLDNAIRSGIYGEAKWRRCGWHIIHQGCKNILYTCFITGNKNNQELKEVIGNVKAWVQESLMKEVEDEREYKMYVSKSYT